MTEEQPSTAGNQNPFGQAQEGMKQEIEKILTKLGDSVTEADKAKQRELMSKIFLEGIPPKTAMGFSDEFVEALYANAYRLFRGGNYKTAESIFRILCMMDQTDPRFPFGLGASLQKQKFYDLAIEAYYLASIMEPPNPLPPFYMYYCYIKVDEFFGAYLMLKNTISRIQAMKKPNPALAKMKTRCEFLLKGLAKYHPEILEQEENLRKAQQEIQAIGK